MYDYSMIGDEVVTSHGVGRYLQHKNGKVIVLMDHGMIPVEFDASDVWI